MEYLASFQRRTSMNGLNKIILAFPFLGVVIIGVSFRIELLRLKRYLTRQYPNEWRQYQSSVVFGRYDEIQHLESAIQTESELRRDKLVASSIKKLKILRALLYLSAIALIGSVLLIARS